MQDELPEENESLSGKFSGAFKHTFRALSQRNFRLYFTGQLVSLSGTWMQNLALSWLVYKLTRSSLALGIVDCCAQTPVLLFALLGGWLADRADRRVILISTQLTLMIQSALLAYLVFSQQIQYWQILLLACLSGIANAFEMPARQSLIALMVERQYLVNAISLNSSAFNASRVVGPAIAAVFVSLVGEAWCFAVNSLSFIGSLSALLLMRFPPRQESDGSHKTTIADGIKFAISHKEIGPILRLTMCMGLLGAQIFVLMPVIARETLHGGVDTFGILRTSTGIGSLLAALFLANKASQPVLIKLVAACSVGFPLSLVLFSFSHSIPISVILVFILGFCLTAQLSGSNSLLQLNCPDNLRGRLMSIWTITFIGMAPIGSLLTGFVASKLGALPTIGISGFACLLSALIYVIFKR